MPKTTEFVLQKFTDWESEILMNQKIGGTRTSCRIPGINFYDMGAQVINVKSRGASGSGFITTTTASMILGSSAATLADASDYVVGHGISISGAGIAGALYVGEVTAIAGNIVSIYPPIDTSVASGRTVKHDDTTAITRALLAAMDIEATSSPVVFFPLGIYRCTSTLTTGLKTHLRGCGTNSQTTDVDGNQATTLDFRDMHTGTAIEVAGNALHVRFEDFRMRGPAEASNATTGILTDSAFYLEMHNVTVYGFGQGVSYYATRGRHIGVVIDACYEVGLYLRDCEQWTSFDSLYANTSTGSNIRIGGDIGSNDINFYDRIVDEAFGTGKATVQIDKGSRISFNNCLIYSTRGSGGAGYGIQMGDGTNTPTDVTLNNVHVRPYDLASGSIANNIRIRGTGHRLINVTTQVPSGFAGTDINDAGTGTLMFNVRQQGQPNRFRFVLPTSTSGLASGDLYSNSGVVTVKP